jgi:hypothetical protein
MMEDPSADSEEKREPVSGIDTAAVDSLKVLDPKLPIKEADIGGPTTCAQINHLQARVRPAGLRANTTDFRRWRPIWLVVRSR